MVLDWWIGVYCKVCVMRESVLLKIRHSKERVKAIWIKDAYILLYMKGAEM